MRRIASAVAVATGLLLCLPVAAQEPLAPAGTWTGTWWMGKYEEPLALDLTPARTGWSVTSRCGDTRAPAPQAPQRR